MKLKPEENVINNVLSNLEQHFDLHHQLKVTSMLGAQFDTATYQQALIDSLTNIHTNLHVHVKDKYRTVNPDQLYVLVYEESNVDSTKNEMRLLFPFGANITEILGSYLIKAPKHAHLSQSKINDVMNNTRKQAINDIVLGQLFKFYQPSADAGPIVPNTVLSKIQYKGIKDDPFNLVIKLELATDDVFKPLRTAIHKQEPDTDYNDYSMAPISYIGYNKDKTAIEIVSPLN